MSRDQTERSASSLIAVEREALLGRLTTIAAAAAAVHDRVRPLIGVCAQMSGYSEAEAALDRLRDALDA